METKGFFQFEIIRNVLVSFIRFISTPLLMVYGHYTYFYLLVWRPTLDVRIDIDQGLKSVLRRKN